jgi:hypothetical protein
MTAVISNLSAAMIHLKICPIQSYWPGDFSISPGSQARVHCAPISCYGAIGREHDVSSNNWRWLKLHPDRRA